ncbi:MAG: pyruvate, water dikinase regulatory protein [Bacillota bacterium]
MNDKKASVYVISDSLGDTANAIINSAAVQFEDAEVEKTTFPHVRTVKQLEKIAEKAADNSAIIVFTLAKKEMRINLIEFADKYNLEYIDLLGPVLNKLSSKLKIEPDEIPGLKYNIDQDYFKRIEAMEFTLKFDDLNDQQGIDEADIVLVGISRTSKTPLSIYLSYLGYKTANVPLVPEVAIQQSILENKDRKVIGLTIDPLLLNDIRIERLKKMGLGNDATYAAGERINEEIAYADSLMGKIGCPIIDVTDKTIEETASEVLAYVT